MNVLNIETSHNQSNNKNFKLKEKQTNTDRRAYIKEKKTKKIPQESEAEGKTVIFQGYPSLSPSLEYDCPVCTMQCMHLFPGWNASTYMQNAHSPHNVILVIVPSIECNMRQIVRVP